MDSVKNRQAGHKPPENKEKKSKHNEQAKSGSGYNGQMNSADEE